MKVFLSYAHENGAAALSVAAGLRGAGVQAQVDVDAVGLGDSFVSYMESSLDTADYCLLLWSTEAARKPWVRVEWEAALVRSVAEKQAFLITGRLDTQPLPRLLAARLAVDLHPEIGRGVSQVVALLRADEKAAAEAQAPVARPRTGGLDEPAVGDEVYLLSDLFGLAIPLRVDLRAPSSVVVAQVVKRLSLPTHWSYNERFGEHFHYALVRAGTALALDQSIATQGVGPGTVLTLQLERRPFSAVAPVEGQQEATRFRAGGEADIEEQSRRKAYAALAAQLRSQGLRPSAAWLGG
jgi:hypothetical protein